MDILFVESATFSEKVDSFLNGDEQDALRLLLAVKPLSGKPSTANENILEIFFARCYVSYAIGSTGTEIYLLDIAAAPTPVPTPEEKEGLADKIKGTAGILIIKELLGEAWKWVKEHLPDWGDYF